MANTHGFTIVNVDDNGVSRYGLSRILRVAGFKVKEATTGHEALRLATENPDLILLNVSLPDISGFEVCRRIKANPGECCIPVLLISADFVRGRDKAQGLDCGADGYLVSPIEPQELIATVNALIRTRRAEVKAQTLSDQWQTTFDAVGDGVALLDSEHRIARCNKAFASLLGKPAVDILGRRCEELIPGTLNWMEISPFVRVLKTHRRESADWPIGPRWFHLTADPVWDPSGALSAAILVATDITERKQAEQERAQLLLREQQARQAAERAAERTARLQAVTAALSKAITPSDVAAVVIDQGLAALGAHIGVVAVLTTDATRFELVRAIGYPPQVLEAWQYFPADAPVPIADAVRSRQPVLLESLEARNASYPNLGDLHLVTGSGALAAIPLIVDERALGGIGLSFPGSRAFSEEDRGFMLTLAHQCAQAIERSRLYEAERRARAEAEAANRIKDEFLATVSHELRTPLASMLGWARLLRTGNLDHATMRRALDTIERSATAQVRLIEDLLDVSRIITGKLRLHIRPIELPAIIEEAVDSVRPAAEAKGIQLDLMLDPFTGPISGDPDRLQQVLWNLVSNAVKFTPEGGCVQLRLEYEPSHARITVIDTGIGIHQDFLPYVFDCFRQADSTDTRRHGGLGLGLAIVRHLVELHGGTVGVESPGEGRGATFVVRLPLVARLPKDRPQPVFSNFKRQVRLDSLPALSGLRVLVVDDRSDTGELVKVMLEWCGAKVTAVRSANEALAALQQRQPDVLVSDIAVQGEDGYAFIRAVRGLPPERGGQVPAVALSAYTRAEDRARTLSAGYQIHLTKPVETTELVTVVANLVGRAAR